jgi:hypothetical protein
MNVLAYQKYQAPNHHGVNPSQSVHVNYRHSHSWDPTLARQTTWSNQIMQRMLRTRAIQAKLKVNTPRDKYELEADRVAEQVMRMPEPDVQGKPG